MELKPGLSRAQTATDNSFNRTFMELKQDKGGEPYYANKVLIGPSWN